VEPRVGERIRSLREQAGFSLRSLSERCGLSVNAISLIERGENSPTVSSLHRLATALGVSLMDLFRDEDNLGVSRCGKEQRLDYREGGVLMECLGTGLRSQQLEPFLITVDPGAGNQDPVVHPGQEFVHCLAGEIEYWVEGRVHRLRAGDSLLLEAARPHCFQNPGRSRARILVVFHCTGSFDIARRRHLEAQSGKTP
jgi:transcriptional regulator with XRE-family HTH domain